MSGRGLRKSPLRIQAKVPINNIEGIPNAAIKRISKQADVKRLAADSYPAVRESLYNFLDVIIKESAIITEHDHRKILTKQDILYVLKKHGITYYG